MKRFPAYILLVSLLVSSCIIDPLYIQLPGTYWTYSTETQTARMLFQDETHTSVLQFVPASGATQIYHGTYTTDGHSVDLTGRDWSNNIHLVRTFSHLKNSSTNKNLTPLKPFSHESLSGSVWSSLVNRDLQFSLFMEDGKCIQGTFLNVAHREGYEYGWKWKSQAYTLSGNQLSVGKKTATTFEDFIVVDTLSALLATPAFTDSGTSSLEGTFWTLPVSGTPGVIIFTGSSSFTRILVASEITYQVSSGTYTTDGASISFSMKNSDGETLKETCPISGDRFTFMERTYTRDVTPQGL